VIVTGDNGMSFPHAKANLYEHGFHVPLAISWPQAAPGGRVVDDLIGFVDLTATIVDAAGVSHPKTASGEDALVGKSLLDVLQSSKEGRVDQTRTMVFSGRERHSSARYQNAGYPCRAVRTDRYLFIRNFHPERWPAGDPEPPYAGGGRFMDIDAPSPSKITVMLNPKDPRVRLARSLAVDKRPAQELYDLRRDPDQLKNVAGDGAYEKVRAELSDALKRWMEAIHDPRAEGGGDAFDSYPYYPEDDSRPRDKPPQPPPVRPRPHPGAP